MTDEVIDAMTLDNVNVWNVREMPSFEGWKAFILPGAFYGQCVALFAQAGFERANSVEEADVVVFIGGVDVDPALYGERPISFTQIPSPSRDQLEKQVYDKCVEMGKPMFGICRGAQFLHVMNKGSLWQHVENHAGPDHYIYDVDDDCLVMATSLHHQMLAINDRIDVVAVCKDQVSKRFYSADMKLDLENEGSNANVEIEIEAGIYWDTRCFFVQGHPEIGSLPYATWCMEKFWDFCEALTEFDEDSDDEMVSALTANE